MELPHNHRPLLKETRDTGHRHETWECHDEEQNTKAVLHGSERVPQIKPNGTRQQSEGQEHRNPRPIVDPIADGVHETALQQHYQLAAEARAPARVQCAVPSLGRGDGALLHGSRGDLPDLFFGRLRVICKISIDEIQHELCRCLMWWHLISQTIHMPLQVASGTKIDWIAVRQYQEVIKELKHLYTGLVNGGNDRSVQVAGQTL
mmetsp:Transcript_39965/g.64887  ORF Transcript_39965/g.64887 Transcript_39965/m.64887 type:complete len:205 (-) Transcript_39965:151-765(-)